MSAHCSNVIQISKRIASDFVETQTANDMSVLVC